MLRHRHIPFIAAALALRVCVVAPTPGEPTAGAMRATCIEWQKSYGSFVPPDVWGVAGDGAALDRMTTSDVDPEDVDAILAMRPEGCPMPEPPPGVEPGEGGWSFEEEPPPGSAAD